ncbi:MAG: ATP-dependent Clp protease ATP-binding subunit, partial [Desulfamplus sp.]|nr:ATP-dependent Clp protease ATP-binding subunit [Desulfamplus sp.]
MKEFFIETDPFLNQTEQIFNGTDQMNYLHEDIVSFSRESVLDLRKRAEHNPVTPLIVQKIAQSSRQHSKGIEKGRLYKVASEILVNGEGSIILSGDRCTFSIHVNNSSNLSGHGSTTHSSHGTALPGYDTALSGYDTDLSGSGHILSAFENTIVGKKEATYQNSRRSSGLAPSLNQSDSTTQMVPSHLPLSLVKYNDPMEEMDQLIAQVVADGKIPVLWSKARGLMLKHLSKQYPLFADVNTAKTADPKEIIRFIISRPQGRIVYILEDFHHYIGEKDVVNPAVGEIRSLIKDLNRTLGPRGEQVYLFVPESYDMPPELALFFAHSPKRPKAVNGYLDRYGHLMTDSGYLAKTKPLIGGSAVIERLIQILTQMETNNPLLVGYPGVGKTAVVEGLAMSMATGAVSARLKGKMLYSLSLNSLIAGTRYRGDLEVRLQGLMDEMLCKKDKIIIFIDEIHTLLDAGAAEGSMSASEFLKPLLARGEFPCIGATTFEGA